MKKMTLCFETSNNSSDQGHEAYRQELTAECKP